MASPLTFLRRLVSRGGARKQEADRVDDAQLDPGPTHTVSEEGLEVADRPAGLAPPYQDPSDAVSAETASVDETGAQIDGTVDGSRAFIPAVGGSASDRKGVAVTAAHDAMQAEPAAEGPARKQKAISKSNRPAVVGAQVFEGPRTPSDETIRLDEEIKVLRGQLAIRLKIQNAQLKKMLERFNR
nr:hypothetical protein REQ54_04362 [Rhizobium sp. Q54]